MIFYDKVEGEINLSHAATKWLSIVQKLNFKWTDLSYVAGLVVIMGERTKAKLETSFGSNPFVDMELQHGTILRQGNTDHEIDLKTNLQYYYII